MHDGQERYAWLTLLVKPPFGALMAALAGGALWYWGVSEARVASDLRQRQEQQRERQARQLRRLEAALADHPEGKTITAAPDALTQLCEQNAERYGVSIEAWQPAPPDKNATVVVQGTSANLLRWWDATLPSDAIAAVHHWQWERLSERQSTGRQWPAASDEAQLTISLQPALQYWKGRA